MENLEQLIRDFFRVTYHDELQKTVSKSISEIFSTLKTKLSLESIFDESGYILDPNKDFQADEVASFIFNSNVLCSQNQNPLKISLISRIFLHNINYNYLYNLNDANLSLLEEKLQCPFENGLPFLQIRGGTNLCKWEIDRAKKINNNGETAKGYLLSAVQHSQKLLDKQFLGTVPSDWNYEFHYWNHTNLGKAFGALLDFYFDDTSLSIEYMNKSETNFRHALDLALKLRDKEKEEKTRSELEYTLSRGDSIYYRLAKAGDFRNADDLIKSIIRSKISRLLGNTQRVNYELMGISLFRLAHLASKNKVAMPILEKILSNNDREGNGLANFDNIDYKGLLIALAQTAYENFQQAINRSEKGQETIGYFSYQARCELLEGRIIGSSNKLKEGIDKLKTVASELKNRRTAIKLDLRNTYSELAEACADFASLTRKAELKIEYYMDSINFYLLSLQEGKEPRLLITYFGFSWFKLAQQTLGMKNFSEFRGSYLIDWMGINTNNPNNRNIQTEFAVRCLENALYCCLMAKSEYADSSNELMSKTGNICLELADLEYQLGNGDKINGYLVMAYKNIVTSRQGEFPYAYVLQARLSDKIKEICPALKEMSGYGWKKALEDLFDLSRRGKVQLKKYSKGSSQVYEMVDQGFPIRYAFIIKEFGDGVEANREFLITKCVNKALKGGGVNFSRPLSLVEHKNKYYLILQRSEAKDLEDTLKYDD